MADLGLDLGNLRSRVLHTTCKRVPQRVEMHSNAPYTDTLERTRRERFAFMLIIVEAHPDRRVGSQAPKLRTVNGVQVGEERFGDSSRKQAISPEPSPNPIAPGILSMPPKEIRIYLPSVFRNVMRLT